MPKCRFSHAFKLEVVRQLAEGKTRSVEVWRTYHLAPPSSLAGDATMRCAVRRRSRRTAPSTDAGAERRIADLERRCQQLLLENTILKSALSAGPTPPGMPG
jgi:transposase-like protein